MYILYHLHSTLSIIISATFSAFHIFITLSAAVWCMCVMCVVFVAKKQRSCLKGFGRVNRKIKPLPSPSLLSLFLALSKNQQIKSEDQGSRIKDQGSTRRVKEGQEGRCGIMECKEEEKYSEGKNEDSKADGGKHDIDRAVVVAFIQAARNGEYDSLTRYLDEGMDINAKDKVSVDYTSCSPGIDCCYVYLARADMRLCIKLLEEDISTV